MKFVTKRIIVITRAEQYQNIKKYNMRFDYKKQYCWFEKDCGVKQGQKSVDY